MNVIDAAAAGVKDGLWLALNVAAMLIGFLAFIALFDAMLGLIYPGLRLEAIFGRVFAPVAFLIGVDPADTHNVGTLLGMKLAANEHVAYLKLKEWKAAGETFLSTRSQLLSVYALTGFANFASVGDSTRWDRLDRSGSSGRPRPARDVGPVRGVPGDLDQCGGRRCAHVRDGWPPTVTPK